ncbi:MFS transporter [Streptomyces sp. NPDC019224]|uniref:MFS transporter n=1 Tax=Streptomyces sp. NPDC019224 TaxID=3154484 RepID=UPI0033D335C7
MRLPPVLRDRRFSLLVSGQFVSALGDGMFPIAVAVALLNKHGAGAIASILGARAIGALVGILLGGALVDRFSRTRVMWVADVVRLVAVGSMIWAVTLDTLLPANVCMTVVGLATSFFNPAFRALIPRTVPAGAVKQANSINSTILQTATVCGPALAGALLAVSTPETILWINTASFALSVLTLLCIREQAAGPVDRRDSALVTALGGLRAVAELRWLAALVVTGVLQMALAVAPWFTFLPVVSIEDYGSSGPYSMSMTAYAVGGIAGALLAGKVTPRLPGIAVIVGPCLFSTILFCLASGVPAAVLVLVHLIAGAGLQFSGVFQMTAIHEQVPDHLLGRVMSLMMLGGALLTPISYGLMGGLADAFGSRTVLAVGGALATVILLLPLLLPDFRRLSNARQKVG